MIMLNMPFHEHVPRRCCLQIREQYEEHRDIDLWKGADKFKIGPSRKLRELAIDKQKWNEAHASRLQDARYSQDTGRRC